MRAVRGRRPARTLQGASKPLFLSIQRLLGAFKPLFLSIQRLLRASKLLFLSIQRPGDCFPKNKHSKSLGPAQKQTWGAAQASSNPLFLSIQRLLEASKPLFFMIQRPLRASKLMFLSIQRPGHCFSKTTLRNPPPRLKNKLRAPPKHPPTHYFCVSSPS